MDTTTKVIAGGVVGLGMIGGGLVLLDNTKSQIVPEASYFAQVDTDGTVLNVIVADQSFIDSGAEGNPASWIQTPAPDQPGSAGKELKYIAGKFKSKGDQKPDDKGAVLSDIQQLASSSLESI